MAASGGARELLRRVGVEADLCDLLGEEDDLLTAGVGSAELIELGLLVEEALGQELTGEEVERLTTLRDIDAFLGAHASGASELPGPPTSS